MRAGSLNKRISIQARGVARDELNGPSSSWAEVAMVWADIEPMTARERLVAQANRSVLTHTVTIRYQAQFADPIAVAGMRVLYGARIFAIHGVIDPSESHQQLNLSCSEGLGDD